jgi:hypothetical protein
MGAQRSRAGGATGPFPPPEEGAPSPAGERELARFLLRINASGEVSARAPPGAGAAPAGVAWRFAAPRSWYVRILASHGPTA